MHTISREEYAKAVIACVHLAHLRTGGSRVAAQVLLSAYNGDDFQLDVSDLCNLDRTNFENAMMVIRGRYETSLDPHSVVENGSKIFHDLWDKWGWLQVVERGKRDCPVCGGRGAVYINPDDDEDLPSEPCTHCSGTGRVCRCV